MLIRDTNINVDRDRCIACGICVKHCVMDNLRLSVAPCRQSCPLHLNCQGFIRLVAQGKEQQALETIGEFGPFLGLLGLLCHAPCEKACARSKVDRPVMIRMLHRYLAISQSKPLWTVHSADNTQPAKKVAVWGSGPGAMMAAWRLRRLGHQVEMFVPASDPGSALGDADADSQKYRNELETVADAIAAAGTEIKTSTEAERTIARDDLISTYDAIVISYRNDREISWLWDDQNADREPLHSDPVTLQDARQQKFFLFEDFNSNGTKLVTALANGQKAAESVDRVLAGKPLMWERGFWRAYGYVKNYAPPYESARHIQQETSASGISASGRRKDHQNEPATSNRLTKAEAQLEAERCLSCGRPFDQNNTCWYCLPCEIECPHDAIEVRIPYLLR